VSPAVHTVVHKSPTHDPSGTPRLAVLYPGPLVVQIHLVVAGRTHLMAVQAPPHLYSSQAVNPSYPPP